MIDDVATNKAAIIRRCLARVQEEFSNDLARLDNFTVQDAIILNILRAGEAAIDLAMHLVAVERLGIPQTNRDAFDLLEQKGIITEQTSSALKNMVGFRNVAVHSYQKLERKVLEAILLDHLLDFEIYLKELAQ